MGAPWHVRFSLDQLPPDGGRWVQVAPGHAVNEVGTIMSLYSGKPMVIVLGSNGRPMTAFRGFGDKSAKTKYQHVVVCEAFHGPRPDGATASHLNGDKTDNRASNLVWESMAENLARREAHGTLDRGFANSRACVTPEDVALVKQLVAEGVTHLAVARRIGVSRTTISRIVNGQRFQTRESQSA